MTCARLVDLLSSPRYDAASKALMLHEAFLAGTVDDAQRDALYFQHINHCYDESPLRSDPMDSMRTE